ncbi:hypothetical protein AB0L04_10285 [Streptomyces glaucescens]|uniref:hypothetical protein n=1 Tax=Streptomyces glaucescens TaxID=1907 RepID=UPI00344CEE64
MKTVVLAAVAGVLLQRGHTLADAGDQDGVVVLAGESPVFAVIEQARADGAYRPLPAPPRAAAWPPTTHRSVRTPPHI